MEHPRHSGAAERAVPLTRGGKHRRIGRCSTENSVAPLGISINTVANLAANAYKKLGVHGAAAAVHAHRDAHFYCGTRVDFVPIRERLQASRSTWVQRNDGQAAAR